MPLPIRSSPLTAFFACSLLTLLNTTSPAAPTPLPATEAGYDQTVAAAKAFVSEGSWAKARDTFAAALGLAPDSAAHRWCELWLEDAAWRTEDAPKDWDTRQIWREHHLATLNALIAPYSNNGESRDEFWVAVLESRTALKATGFDDNEGAWNDRFEIADYFGSQPPSAAAAARYVVHFKDALSNSEVRLQPEHLSRLFGYLSAGARAAGTADDRAWCFLQIASLARRSRATTLEERAGFWAQALAASRGTRWDARIKAGEFIFRAANGWSPNTAPNSPADLPTLLRELDAVRNDLKATADAAASEDLKLLDGLERWWTRPILELSAPALLRPGEPVRAGYGASGFDQLTVEIYRSKLEAWAPLYAIAAEYARAAIDPTASVSLAMTLPTGAEPILVKTIPLSGPGPHPWHSGTIELAPELPPGFYVLSIRGDRTGSNEKRLQYFAVSDLGAVAIVPQTGPSSIYVFRSGTGDPMAGVPIHGVAGRYDTQVVWAGTTDADGMVLVPSLAEEGRYWREDHVVALIGDQPVCVWRGKNMDHEQHYVADVFLDRALYRPGETVQWMLIVRERRDGRFVIPGKKNLRMTVELNEDKLVDGVAVNLNRFGVAHGKIAVPATARPGEADLTLAAPGNDDVHLLNRDGFFSVDNFVPPALQAAVELACPSDALRPGREITVRVRAGYLSGGPAAGARVECSFSAGHGRRRLENTDAQRELDGWRRELAKHLRTGTTDGTGAAEFHLAMPASLPEPFELRVNAAVVPEGGQSVKATAGFAITNAGATVDPLEWQEPRAVHPGETVAFECKVIDGAGQPRSFEGIARLVERRWVEAWLDPESHVVSGAGISDARDKLRLPPTEDLTAPWKRLHASYIDTPAVEVPVKAGANGLVSVKLTIPHAGIFQLRLAQSDGNSELPFADDSHEDADALLLFAADETTESLALPPTAIKLVGPAALRPDEPLRLIVVLPEGQRRGLLAIDGEDSVVSRRFSAQGRVGLVVIDHPPRCAGHLTIGVVTLDVSPRVRANSVQIPVEDERSHLAVQLQPAENTTRPGTPSSVRVAVKDRYGKPAQAELSLGGSDEAVNLLARRELPVAPSFWQFSSELGVLFALPPPWQTTGPVERISDFRPGATLNPSHPGQAGEETVPLSPFEVRNGPTDGYRASSTLSASRRSAPEPDIPLDVQIAALDQASRPSVEIRRHFSSTAFWEPEVITDEKGEAAVEFKYPDNLTKWRIEAYAVGEDGNSFGRAATFTQTSLPLQARLQAPRFLVAGDTAEPSALLVNRSDAELNANAELIVSGAVVAVDQVGAHLGAPSLGGAAADQRQKERAQPLDQLEALSLSNGVAVNKPGREERTQQAAPLQAEGVAENDPGKQDQTQQPARLQAGNVAVPKQGEAHVAWIVKATQPGDASLTLTARAGSEGDGMALVLPVLEDGIQQETAASGRLAGDARMQTLELALPEKLDAARTTVTVQLSPGHASAILDALPYLVDYPYGCVEQTMSRFLPAVAVRKTLTDFGLDAAAVERRILSRESKDAAARRAKAAGLGQLDKVIEQSLSRLTKAQRDDGAFGWWPDAPSTDLWMTGYVAWGLGLAETAGIDVPDNLAKETDAALVRILSGESALSDAGVWALAALARSMSKEIDATASRETFHRSFEAREKLSAAGRACLALASVKFGDDAQRAVLLRNLENGAQRVPSSDLGDTVHWGSTGGYWRAMDGAVESTALTLLALLELDPKHPFVEPAANWLLLNRRSARWASTRDTAFAVLALTRYVEVRREFQPDAGVEVVVNGQSAAKVEFTRESLLDGPVTLVLLGAPSGRALPTAVGRILGAGGSSESGPAVHPYHQAATENSVKCLRPGANRIKLQRVSGATPVYAVALASSWAGSDVVKPAGHLVAVDRGFVREKAQATLIGTLKITPEPMVDGVSAAAGEQVSAHVTLTIPNELEYVMVEVPKPAGCEPLNPLSGWDARIAQVEPDTARTTTANSDSASAPIETNRGSVSAASSGPANTKEGQPVYREEHDDKSVFFLDHLEAGTWEIRFGMRATTPGDFRALPATVTAMYVPEIAANSDARRVKILQTK